MLFKKIKGEAGVTSIEYALLSLGIGLAIFTGVSFTGVNTSNTFCTVAGTLGGTGCSQPIKYTTADSYSIPPSDGKMTNAKDITIASLAIDIGQKNVQSITGFYDQYGNELTTPDSLFDAVGLKQEYDNYVSADKAYFDTLNYNYYGQHLGGNSYASYADYQTALDNAYQNFGNAETALHSKTLGNIFIPDPSKITFTNSYGTSTYVSSFVNGTGLKTSYVQAKANMIQVGDPNNSTNYNVTNGWINVNPPTGN